MTIDAHPAAQWAKLQGLTTRQLADLLGVSPRTLYIYLGQYRKPGRPQAERLAAATGGAIPPEVWLWPERYPQFIPLSLTSKDGRRE
jgi:lambda repressor-like predicted transcriptional regulator